VDSKLETSATERDGDIRALDWEGERPERDDMDSELMDFRTRAGVLSPKCPPVTNS